MERQKMRLEDVGRIDVLFDADPKNRDNVGEIDNQCGLTWTCPEFAKDTKTGTIKFISKAHDVVDMPTSTYNDFVRMSKSGEIQKLGPVLMGSEHYKVGTISFTADKNINRIVVTGEKGKQADMAVEHFNRFVDAARDGKMQELKALIRK